MTRPHAAPGTVAVLTYDGLCTFEFGIAVELFGLPRPEFDFPWYRFVAVAARPDPMRAAGGIRITARAGLEQLPEARTIIIPGWRDPNASPPPDVLDALRRAADNSARFLSICSGAFVLAAAGLLDGKKATTHWKYLPQLHARYPEIRRAGDVLYVEDGPIITSAGSAAGIDACLHLIRKDFGTAVANRVARRLVMSPFRDGGQAQYVDTPMAEHPGKTIANALQWARERIDQPIGLKDFAASANMSPRTFQRRFRNAMGLSPLSWLAAERIRRARELLESSPAGLDRIASCCGYRSPETFRTAFRRHTGTSPTAYRVRFRPQQ
ncbi:MAG TPA: transcriptional regulator FtrA [Devosia sp.]|nr:transcriptional regulator FtrA [Devosia sp.]